jgi:hypothetical protein
MCADGPKAIWQLKLGALSHTSLQFVIILGASRSIYANTKNNPREMMHGKARLSPILLGVNFVVFGVIYSPQGKLNKYLLPHSYDDSLMKRSFKFLADKLCLESRLPPPTTRSLRYLQLGVYLGPPYIIIWGPHHDCSSYVEHK